MRILCRNLFCGLFFVAAHAVAQPAVLLDGKPAASLADAMSKAEVGSRIELAPGVYEQAGVLRADFVSIVGEPGTVIANTAVEGKAALVIKGSNTLIAQIECHGIQVKDQNGACVRLEGSNLELDKVYFHDSEQGVLTGKNPGFVVIRNSRFQRLGKRGRAHAIYVGGGELQIINSEILASKDEGHEVKSRARRTVIESSLIASLDSMDSRLLDIANGGELIVNHSVLQQGKRTANNDMIGFGLEGVKYPLNRIELHRNVFVIDQEKTRILSARPKTVRVDSSLNTIVGDYRQGIDGVALHLEDRAAIGLPSYPSLEGIRRLLDGALPIGSQP
ncbi:hypothetical protein [Motiliproteus sp. SC1-56]|uniref:hypothetical protein n=1 Tax=Motiliproteus sp. SC1-56 TaxID=2799565 RepID=UPI001A8F41FB|nr:hypothetical protein [Motiliproteus sp. SC1-56]